MQAMGKELAVPFFCLFITKMNIEANQNRNDALWLQGCSGEGELAGINLADCVHAHICVGGARKVLVGGGFLVRIQPH